MTRHQQLCHPLENVPQAAAIAFFPSVVETFAVLWRLRPQLGSHLERLARADSAVAALTSAVLIIMEDTRGKINRAVVDFIMVSMEVAGLFLKSFYPPLCNSLPNCRKDRLKERKVEAALQNFNTSKLFSSLLVRLNNFYDFYCCFYL